jgi:hypothetical protein
VLSQTMGRDRYSRVGINRRLGFFSSFFFFFFFLFVATMKEVVEIIESIKYGGRAGS